jgi:hypothetical protein
MAAGVNILIMHYWQFGGSITYIAPTLAIVGSSVLNVGEWMLLMSKVTKALIVLPFAIGGGYLYEYPPAQAMFMLIGMTTIMSSTIFDDFEKKMANIYLVLGLLMPFVTQGAMSGISAFQDIATTITFAFFLIIVPLALLPSMALAATQARAHAVGACDAVLRVSELLLQLFDEPDALAIHSTEVREMLYPPSTTTAAIRTFTAYAVNHPMFAAVIPTPFAGFPGAHQAGISCVHPYLYLTQPAWPPILVSSPRLSTPHFPFVFFFFNFHTRLYAR